MSIQKTVEVPEYVDLVALLGAKDKNLDAIKADTSIKISVNGDNKIYLFGKDNEVNRIINVFDKMMEYLDTQKQLSKEDVEWLLQRSHDGSLFDENTERKKLKPVQKDKLNI